MLAPRPLPSPATRRGRGRVHHPRAAPSRAAAGGAWWTVVAGGDATTRRCVAGGGVRPHRAHHRSVDEPRVRRGRYGAVIDRRRDDIVRRSGRARPRPTATRCHHRRDRSAPPDEEVALRLVAPVLRPCIEHCWFVTAAPGAPLDLRVEVFVDLRAYLVSNFGAPWTHAGSAIRLRGLRRSPAPLGRARGVAAAPLPGLRRPV